MIQGRFKADASKNYMAVSISCRASFVDLLITRALFGVCIRALRFLEAPISGIPSYGMSEPECRIEIPSLSCIPCPICHTPYTMYTINYMPHTTHHVHMLYVVATIIEPVTSSLVQVEQPNLKSLVQ